MPGLQNPTSLSKPTRNEASAADRRLNAIERRLVDRALSTSDLNGTAVQDWTDLTCTFEALEGHTYIYELSGHYLSSVLGDVIRFVVTDGANTVKATPAQADFVVSSAANASGVRYTFYEDFTFTATGTVARKIRFSRAAGTGNVRAFADANRPALLYAYDAGLTPE
jgi:hypothetical protein